MTSNRARVAEDALQSLDNLVHSTLKVLTAYQIAGDPSGPSNGEAMTCGITVLKESRRRQAAALQNLRAQLQQLAEAPSSSLLATG